MIRQLKSTNLSPVLVPLVLAISCTPHGHGDRNTPKGNVPSTVAPNGSAPARLNERVAPKALDATKGWPFADSRAADNPDDAKKKPFGIDALYKVKFVSAPAWSPDGSHLLFTVSTHYLKKGKSNTDIYMVDRDGKNLRQMTRFEGYDGNPVWAPDGKSFLFVSSRKNGSQVWVMPSDGGEARQVTHVSTGVSSPIWSPDGKKIAFSSKVYPELGANDAENKKALDLQKKSTIEAHVADHLLYRHWTSWADGRRSHVLLVDVDSGKTTDLTPGDFESPAFELGGGQGFVFSPDGSELCLVSNREDPDAQAWTTNKDLFVTPTAEGTNTPLNLTESNKAFDGHPRYSPDGRYIAYQRQERPGFESDRFRLTIYDRKTGQSQVLTEGFDYWVEDFHWAADSKSIVFRAPVKGRFPLFRVTLGGSISRIAQVPSIAAFDLSSKGDIAFTYSSVGQPMELYILSGNKVRKVTSFNDELVKNYDIRPVEETWIEGADGVPVHTFIVKPHGYRKGQRYPLILNVHGGPQYQWSDRFRGDWQVYPAAGYIVAFPNPHGSVGYGQEYTDAISKDWGGKVYQDVMKVADELSKRDDVAPDRMGAMGWSYGGYFMNWLLGHTDRFRAIASMMGVYDLAAMYGSTEELWFVDWDLGGPPWEHPKEYQKWSPSSYVEKFKTPTLIITGERDYRIPYTQSLELFTALRRRNVPARLIVFPNDGHWPRWTHAMPLYYAAHLDWFHRYLGGDPSPYDPVDMARGRAFQPKPKSAEPTSTR